jgi:hypothetical protein
MDLKSVIDSANHAKEFKKDIIVDASCIQVSTMNVDKKGLDDKVTSSRELTFSFPELGQLPLTDWAHTQVSGVSKIPRVYYNRMLQDGATDLLKQNVDRYFPRSNGVINDSQGNVTGVNKRKQLFRTLDGRIRGVVSSRFRALDNADTLVMAMEKLVEYDAKIQQAFINDTNIYLKATTPRLTQEVRVGDVVQQGILIKNSEVGSGALSIEPLYWRLWCANGAISQGAFREIHLGSDKAEGLYSEDTLLSESELVHKKVRDIISKIFNGDLLAKYADDARRSADERIENPVQYVNDVSASFKFSEQLRDSILNKFIEQKDDTRWGLSNAVTDLAKSFPIAGQIKMEKIGYKIMMKDFTMVKAEDVDVGNCDQ